MSGFGGGGGGGGDYGILTTERATRLEITSARRQVSGTSGFWAQLRFCFVRFSLGPSYCLWGLPVQNGSAFSRIQDGSFSRRLNFSGAEAKCRLKLGKSPQVGVLFSLLSSGVAQSVWGKRS